MELYILIAKIFGFVCMGIVLFVCFTFFGSVLLSFRRTAIRRATPGDGQAELLTIKDLRKELKTVKASFVYIGPFIRVKELKGLNYENIQMIRFGRLPPRDFMDWLQIKHPELTLNHEGYQKRS